MQKLHWRIQIEWRIKASIILAMDKKGGYLQILKICNTHKLRPSQVFPIVKNYKDLEDIEGTHFEMCRKENYNFLLPYMLTKGLRLKRKFKLP
jgi:hypothetical protein